MDKNTKHHTKIECRTIQTFQEFDIFMQSLSNIILVNFINVYRLRNAYIYTLPVNRKYNKMLMYEKLMTLGCHFRHTDFSCNKDISSINVLVYQWNNTVSEHDV